MTTGTPDDIKIFLRWLKTDGGQQQRLIDYVTAFYKHLETDKETQQILIKDPTAFLDWLVTNGKWQSDLGYYIKMSRNNLRTYTGPFQPVNTGLMQ